MSKIYHIKPKNQTKPPKDPLWKYILVIVLENTARPVLNATAAHAKTRCLVPAQRA